MATKSTSKPPSTSLTIPLRAADARALGMDLIAKAAHQNEWILITLNGPTVISVLRADRRDNDEDQ